MSDSADEGTSLFVVLVPRWRHAALATAAPRHARYVSATDLSQLLVAVEANDVGVAIVDPELFNAAEATQRIALATQLQRNGWPVFCDVAQTRDGFAALVSVAQNLCPLDVILRPQIALSPGDEALVGDAPDVVKHMLALTAGGNLGMGIVARLAQSL